MDKVLIGEQQETLSREKPQVGCLAVSLRSSVWGSLDNTYRCLAVLQKLSSSIINETNGSQNQ